MKTSRIAASLVAVAGGSAVWVPESTLGTDLEAAKSLIKLTAAVADGSLKEAFAAENVTQTCNLSNLSVRREYSHLSDTEKLAYTNAVICLMDAPSKIAEGLAPGAKSRYDDFVAIHVNQTETIHFTGSFLSWHRYFIYSFERALQDECGYQGTLPYWNWGKTAKDPLNSPHMNGDKYSQGGNGVWDPHNCTSPVPGCEYCIPVVEGRGGGCVETGPYAGRMCNISATSPSLVADDAPVAGTKLSYAPRCIRRDISPNITAMFSTDAKHLDLLTNSEYQTDIGPYQDRLQGKPFDQCDPGQHGAGHFTWAADPGGDVYNTPNDPLFWLHHGGIDRSWWIWQNQDPVERAFQIDGTLTLLDDPPSRNATVEDVLDLMYAAPADTPPSSIKNHASSVAGPYCYIYI